MGKLGYAGKLFREFFRFAKANKVYWVVPLILILTLIVVTIVLGETAAPFIYTLF